MTNDNNFTYANVLYEYYGDARISPDTDEFTLTICRDSILISHLADNNAYLRTRGARMTRLTLQHFSSDLTLIVFAIHRHLHIAKVFELASRLFFLQHLLRIFLPHSRRFFLSLFLCLGMFSELKKVLNEGQQKGKDEGQRKQFIILIQTSSEYNESTTH